MVKLVLLPGMDGTGDLFAPFLAVHEGRACVVRYPTSGALGYDGLTEVARTLMPAAGEQFVLLGESFSGPIAVSLAAQRPANLLGVILCCSFVRNPQPLFAPLRGLLALLPGRPPLALAEAMLCGRYASPPLRGTLAAALAKVSAETLRARLRAVACVDVVPQLQTVEVPILYLRASEDRLVPAAASELVMAESRHARIVELAGPHFLLQVAPQAAARAIQEFLRQIEHRDSQVA
jgi:pimeloyl-ACP methyl ester carboxylesterase